MVDGQVSAHHPMPENHQISINSLKLYKQAPAPWKLEGEGIILIYKFSKKWLENHGDLPDHLKGNFNGGLGYLMMINYKSSPVGPYKELLFVPGRFSPYNKQSITKIYVNTEVSTQNGRSNWGVPKQTLDISWEKIERTELIQVKEGDKIAFSCELKSGGIPFPVSTSFLPFDLHQLWREVDFFTKPSGNGWGKLAKVKNLNIDPSYFPDLTTRKPLIAVKINLFHIDFPKANYAL